MYNLPCILQEQQAWKLPDSLAYYATHRKRPEELYPSERVFLPEVLPNIQNCLDFGCAAGGFSEIMCYYNPSLEYTGADITPEFLQLGKSNYPDCSFLHTDGTSLPFRAHTFDLVHSSGVLHLNSAHRRIAEELYRVSNHYFLADFRLTHGPAQCGQCRIRFDDGKQDSSPPTKVEMAEF